MALGAKKSEKKKSKDEEEVRQNQSCSLHYPFPSMRILVSSLGPTAFAVTHQCDEEPNCVERLPGGGKWGVPTLTERNKIPALSSEIPAGSLMRWAALQFWNQLRGEKKTRVSEKDPTWFQNQLGRHEKSRFTERFPVNVSETVRLHD